MDAEFSESEVIVYDFGELVMEDVISSSPEAINNYCTIGTSSPNNTVPRK